MNCFRLSAPNSDILYDINISLFTQSFDWPSFIKHIWPNLHVKANLMCWIFINVGILGSEFNTSSFTIGRVQCTRPNVSGVCISVHEAWRDFVIKFFTLHPCVPWIWDSVWPSVIFHASMMAPVKICSTGRRLWWQWTLCRHCNLNTRRVSC